MTILYVCGGLMVAAAIMGAIDYKAAKQKGSLDNLYKEEKPAPFVKQVKTIRAKEYSRAAIENRTVGEAANTKQVVDNNNYPVPATAIARQTISSTIHKKDKMKKRIRFSQFSRSALVREYPIDEEVEVGDTLKTNVGTINF